MAVIMPQGWRSLESTGAAHRELQTLHAFSQGLPDAYTVLHGVHWTRVHAGHQMFGEVDFVIVGPAGDALLIEQKSGFLSESENGLTRTYGDKSTSVPTQMARTATAIEARLKQSVTAFDGTVQTLLYCPDYSVRQPGSAGLDPSRIVDASRREQLCATIRSILPIDAPARPVRADVVRFFADILELVADVGVMAGEAHILYTRLAGGLASWARRIECEPFRLRITATAGSGKSQLAVAVLRDAVAAGRRTLYVCYNRPLADHIATIAPHGAEVATYHQLCDRIARASGKTPDFKQPGAFRLLEESFDGHAPEPGKTYDELIVDEGQDFDARWARNLLKLLDPGGRAWWLEDPMQNLYGREAVDLPGWVRLRSDTNFRSPREILATINRLAPTDSPVEAGSPVTGPKVEVLTYTDTPDLIKQTTRAVTNCIGAGFKREMIAVVTFRGRESSKLTPCDRIGPYKLKSYTGRYDLLGNAERSMGDIAIDSVHRFKGQSAPCIVLTEIDFAEGTDTVNDAMRRRLFVGATRATMKLVLVVSERTARALQTDND